MSETREFSVGVIYTLATGRTFATFDEIHGAIEFVVGSPVWTHHLAMKDLWEDVAACVAPQYPALAALEIPENPYGDTSAASEAWGKEQIRRMEAVAGAATLPVRQMAQGIREPLHPLDGVPEGMPTILLEVDPDAGPEGIRHAAEEIKTILAKEGAGG